jgi:hypothetical protein
MSEEKKEYDNRNRGVAFTPFDNQQYFLQGELDIDGQQLKVNIIRDQLKSGKVIFNIYQKVGVLFDAEKKDEKSPDLTGEIFDKRLAGWKALTKFDKPMLQMRVSEARPKPEEPQQQQQQDTNQQPNDMDDEIPF